MKSSNIVKLILVIFVTSFIGFIFWYIESPDKINREVANQGDQDSISLFPFGLFSSDDDNNSENSDGGSGAHINSNQNLDKDGNIKEEKIPRLRQVTNKPTSGIFMQKLSKTDIFDLNKDREIEVDLNQDDSYSEIRYTHTRNNDVYQTYDFTKTERRIFSQTTLRVFDVLYSDIDTSIIRYDSEGVISTRAFILRDKTEAEKEYESEINGDKKDTAIKTKDKKLDGVFLASGIEKIAVSPDGKEIFYLTRKNSKGVVDGDIHGIKTNHWGENKKEIFQSELTEWNVKWESDKYITLETMPSFSAKTLFYKLNKNTTELKKVQNPLFAGASLPNKDYSKILYSFKNEQDQKNYLIYEDVKTKVLKDTGLQTLVDKCVWSQNNIDVYCAVPTGLGQNQPDSWYKGKNYFTDSIYKINTKTGEKKTILDFILEKVDLDIIKLKIDDREEYLYFIDKKTDFAWTYDLNEDITEEVVINSTDLSAKDTKRLEVAIKQQQEKLKEQGIIGAARIDYLQEYEAEFKHYALLSDALQTCYSFSGTFYDPLSGEYLVREVVGAEGQNCVLKEEMPNGGEMICKYQSNTRKAVADYYKQSGMDLVYGTEEVLNTEGGVANILEKSLRDGTCEVTGYSFLES